MSKRRRHSKRLSRTTGYSVGSSEQYSVTVARGVATGEAEDITLAELDLRELRQQFSQESLERLETELRLLMERMGECARRIALTEFQRLSAQYGRRLDSPPNR
jgi:hypothetical protein